jgi:probable blue pigment (indigoidine) exporter
LFDVQTLNIKIMNVTENPRNLAVLVMVLAPISWGTTYVTVTELLPEGRPLLIASTRVLPAGLILVAAGLLSSPWRPRGSEWRRTALLALCNFALFFPLLAVAVYRLPGGVAAAAGGLQPLLVAGLSGALARRRPPTREVVIGIVAALGVGLVVVRPGADVDLFGVLAAVAANLSFAAGVVLTKRFPPPPNRLAATGWQLLLSGVLLVPLTLAVEGPPPTLTGQNLAGFGYLSLIATAAAFVVWFTGINKLPTAAPPLLGLAAPITGALLGWVVLDQSLSPVQLTGFAMTLGAIAHGAVLGGRAVESARLAPFARWRSAGSRNQPVANPPKRSYCRSGDAVGCVAQSVGRRADGRPQSSLSRRWGDRCAGGVR